MAAAAHVNKMRMRLYLLALALVLAGVTSAAAQTGAPPSDAVNSMLGGWEMSNADRDKTCIITFKLDAAGPGRALELPNECRTTFPNIKDVARSNAVSIVVDCHRVGKGRTRSGLLSECAERISSQYED